MDTWNTLESFFLIESSNRVTRVNETNVCVCACVYVRKRKRKSDESEEIMYSTDTCGFMSRKRARFTDRSKKRAHQNSAFAAQKNSALRYNSSV